MKNIDDMTINELKQEIRDAVNEINTRITDYDEQVAGGILNESRPFEALYDEFVDMDTIREYRGKLVFGFSTRQGSGKRTYKNKAELKEELEALRNFQQRDRFTPKGEVEFKKRSEEMNEDAFNTFKQNYKIDERYPDFDKEDYTKLVETFSSLKSEVEAWTLYKDRAESFVDLYLEANEDDKDNFGSTFVEAISSLRKDGEVINARNVINKLREYL